MPCGGGVVGVSCTKEQVRACLGDLFKCPFAFDFIVTSSNLIKIAVEST